MQHGVPHDSQLVLLERRRGRQIPVQQQVADLEKGRLFRELLDRVATIQQHALVAVDVGDLAVAGGGPAIPGVVGEKTQIPIELAYVEHRRAQGRLHQRDRDSLVGTVQGDGDRLLCRAAHASFLVAWADRAAPLPIDPTGAGCRCHRRIEPSSKPMAPGPLAQPSRMQHLGQPRGRGKARRRPGGATALGPGPTNVPTGRRLSGRSDRAKGPENRAERHSPTPINPNSFALAVPRLGRDIEAPPVAHAMAAPPAGQLDFRRFPPDMPGARAMSRTRFRAAGPTAPDPDRTTY